MDALARKVRDLLEDSSGDVEGAGVSLTRGLDLERDLDLFLGVLALDEFVGGFVGVVAGEPAKNLRFISSIASSDGCTRAWLLPSVIGTPVKLSRPERWVRPAGRLSSSESAALNRV